MIRKIKGYRNMIGKSQRDFARVLGVSEGTYRLKEQGKVEFKKSEMEKIINTLREAGISKTVDDIFF